MARILVVDDEPDVRSLMVIVLEQAGHKVSELESGRHIAEKVSELKPELVVLDVTMPNVDGMTALSELRSNSATRSLPVLMSSAQGQKSTLLQARDLGATDFIVKPWAEGELEWRVAECLARGHRKAA